MPNWVLRRDAITPNMTIETNFLNYAAEKLTQLSGRVETCLGKLTADQIWLPSMPERARTPPLLSKLMTSG